MVIIRLLFLLVSFPLLIDLVFVAMVMTVVHVLFPKQPPTQKEAVKTSFEEYFNVSFEDAQVMLSGIPFNVSHEDMGDGGYEHTFSPADDDDDDIPQFAKDLFEQVAEMVEEASPIRTIHRHPQEFSDADPSVGWDDDLNLYFADFTHVAEDGAPTWKPIGRG